MGKRCWTVCMHRFLAFSALKCHLLSIPAYLWSHFVCLSLFLLAQTEDSYLFLFLALEKALWRAHFKALKRAQLLSLEKGKGKDEAILITFPRLGEAISTRKKQKWQPPAKTHKVASKNTPRRWQQYPKKRSLGKIDLGRLAKPEDRGDCCMLSIVEWGHAGLEYEEDVSHFDDQDHMDFIGEFTFRVNETCLSSDHNIFMAAPADRGKGVPMFLMRWNRDGRKRGRLRKSPTRERVMAMVLQWTSPGATGMILAMVVPQLHLRGHGDRKTGECILL